VIRTVSFLPTLEKNSEIHSTFSEFSRHREKNAELEKTLATQREKEDEAEKTLAEFKTKMEETSKRMFDDAKIQVLKYFVWNISYLQLNRVECLLGASPGPVDPGRFF
jgi:ABC-type Fe3+-citrate transport system substrate-binding protein